MINIIKSITITIIPIAGLFSTLNASNMENPIYPDSLKISAVRQKKQLNFYGCFGRNNNKNYAKRITRYLDQYMTDSEYWSETNK